MKLGADLAHLHESHQAQGHPEKAAQILTWLHRAYGDQDYPIALHLAPAPRRPTPAAPGIRPRKDPELVARAGRRSWSLPGPQQHPQENKTMPRRNPAEHSRTDRHLSLRPTTGPLFARSTPQSRRRTQHNQLRRPTGRAEPLHPVSRRRAGRPPEINRVPGPGRRRRPATTPSVSSPSTST